MTIELFIYLFTIGSTFSSLFTQASKKTFTQIPSNLLALCSSIIVGLGGTFSAYVLLDIPLTLANVICIPLMAVCIWIGSMLGYDKVLQTISQIKR